MLEQCDFMELTEEVLQQCKGFTCKDEDITEFFTQDYADYAYQLLGKSYCFVKPDTSEIVCAFTVANSSVKVDSLPSNLRNKLNRKIPNAKRRHTATEHGRGIRSRDHLSRYSCHPSHHMAVHPIPFYPWQPGFSPRSIRW